MICCPDCRSTNVGTKGWRHYGDGTKKRRYKCHDCKRRFTEGAEASIIKDLDGHPRTPKIFIFDIAGKIGQGVFAGFDCCF